MTAEPANATPSSPSAPVGAAFGAFNSFRKGDALSELNQELVINGLWSRPGLSRRDRRLITMAILATRGATWEAGIHIRSSLANGELTESELEEIAVQIAFYAGWPIGNQFQTAISNRDVDGNQDGQRR